MYTPVLACDSQKWSLTKKLLKQIRTCQRKMKGKLLEIKLKGKNYSIRKNKNRSCHKNILYSKVILGREFKQGFKMKQGLKWFAEWRIREGKGSEVGLI